MKSLRAIREEAKSTFGDEHAVKVQKIAVVVRYLNDILEEELTNYHDIDEFLADVEIEADNLKGLV
jgi:choline kinase